ncbi:MAG: hypothetical protein GX053_05730 [Tissierella sp.]|nr:hypothetical protein [Tissierella sp.]
MANIEKFSTIIIKELAEKTDKIEIIDENIFTTIYNQTTLEKPIMEYFHYKDILKGLIDLRDKRYDGIN